MSEPQIMQSLQISVGNGKAVGTRTEHTPINFKHLQLCGHERLRTLGQLRRVLFNNDGRTVKEEYLLQKKGMSTRLTGPGQRLE